MTREADVLKCQLEHKRMASIEQKLLMRSRVNPFVPLLIIKEKDKGLNVLSSMCPSIYLIFVILVVTNMKI